MEILRALLEYTNMRLFVTKNAYNTPLTHTITTQ